MDVIGHLQPLDVLFAILWAAIMGWGLQTGVIRQLGMLIGVYGGAILAGSLYHQAGQALSLAFGPLTLPLMEFASYILLFFLSLAVIGFMARRAYPITALNPRFGPDNLFGALVAAVWGLMLLITMLTMMRYFTLVTWTQAQATQQALLHQIQLSQVASVLQVVAAPLWQLMVPWFPAPVSDAV